MIHLEKIDYKNVWDVYSLQVSKTQKHFVAPNDISLMQAYVAITSKTSYAYPFAIYNNKKVVGFLMVGYNEYDIEENAPLAVKNNYSIWRFMIDKRFQNRGYGKEAFKLALDFVRTFPSGKAEYCELSYEPENVVAKKLYASFGFVENGEMDGDEVVAVLKL